MNSIPHQPEYPDGSPSRLQYDDEPEEGEIVSYDAPTASARPGFAMVAPPSSTLIPPPRVPTAIPSSASIPPPSSHPNGTGELSRKRTREPGNTSYHYADRAVIPRPGSGLLVPQRPGSSQLAEQQPAKQHAIAQPPSDQFALVIQRMLSRTPNQASLPASSIGGIELVGTTPLSDIAFNEDNRLGVGTFGVVVSGIHKPTGRPVALKRIVMHKEEDGLPLTTIREIKILKALRHRNIIPLSSMLVVKADRSNADEKDLYYMIFPKMKADLAGLLENPSVEFTEYDIKTIMWQLMQGIAYLHRNNIIHRDIKMANLLLSPIGVVKIGDFGLARPYTPHIQNRRYTPTVVTRWYRAPELLLGERQYTPAVDVWSCGCVFGELIKKKPVFPGADDEHQKHLIWELCGAVNDVSWPGWRELEECKGRRDAGLNDSELGGNKKNMIKEYFLKFIKSNIVHNADWPVDLLSQMLALFPPKRITAQQSLEHDYFVREKSILTPQSLARFEPSYEIDKSKFREQKAAANGQHRR